MNTDNNPADDLTRGRTLCELAVPNRWLQGPPFLRDSPDRWPSLPNSAEPEDVTELKQSIFCGLTQTSLTPQVPDTTQFNSWIDLVKETQQCIHGAAADPSLPQPDFRDAEVHLLRASQADCFPEEVKCLQAGKPVLPSSRLSALAPEMDPAMGLIRVGGRFRRMDGVCPTDVHPIILDPSHAVTRLIIKDVDARLLHPGPDRVFAEIRRQYWVLRGRQAVKHHQRTCAECRKWRGKPVVPVL